MLREGLRRMIAVAVEIPEDRQFRGAREQFSWS